MNTNNLTSGTRRSRMTVTVTVAVAVTVTVAVDAHDGVRDHMTMAVDVS